MGRLQRVSIIPGIKSALSLHKAPIKVSDADSISDTLLPVYIPLQASTPSMIRPPSRGSIGIRLNAPKIAETSAHLLANSCSISTLFIISIIPHRIKLNVGPMAAIMIFFKGEVSFKGVKLSLPILRANSFMPTLHNLKAIICPHS